MSESLLFVDDEEDLLEILSEEFEGLGYRVQIARSGYEAMDRINGTSVSLVITDYDIGNGDGISLANFCADHSVPCIVLTGHPVEEIRDYIPENFVVLNKARCMLSGALKEQIEFALRSA